MSNASVLLNIAPGAKKRGKPLASRDAARLEGNARGGILINRPSTNGQWTSGTGVSWVVSLVEGDQS
jgi:hypothetical protein